jgi:4'-phosphopantetheinyl transferase EntD
MNLINDKKIFDFFSETKNGVEALTKSEIKNTKTYNEKRVKDFATGRFCAKQAIENLGLYNIDILTGVEGKPIWPSGLVGSISHCESLTGAIIARKSDYISLGLDIEEIGNVTTDLWEYLFTESEKMFLIGFEDPEKQREQSTILFSMKESFYKLQNPVTNTFLDFLEVELKCTSGRYYLNLLHPINLHERLNSETEVFVKKYNNIIITFCYWHNTH